MCNFILSLRVNNISVFLQLFYNKHNLVLQKEREREREREQDRNTIANRISTTNINLYLSTYDKQDN